MTDPDKPYVGVSVNRMLVEKLEKWLETNDDASLPFRHKSDILNMLMLNFLIKVAGDAELEKLQTKLQHIDTDIHAAIEHFIRSRKRS